MGPAWLQIFQSRLDLTGFFFFVWTSHLVCVEQSLKIIIYSVWCWHHNRDLYTQLMKSRRIDCFARWRITSVTIYIFPRSVRTLLCSDSHANPVIVCGMLWIYFFLICTKEIKAIPQFVSLSTLRDKVIRNNQIIERGLERKLYINTNASGIAGDTKPAVPSLAWECLTSSLHTFALLCKRRKPCTAPQASDKNAQT